ncbi:protein RRNAD1-like, partial [Trifolium pratense]
MLKGENQEDKGKLNCPGGGDANNRSPTVLAGLHACGDLSVIMLKTFLDCRDVKAVVSIGCCYNLLSEESIGDGESQCGFPMSRALRSAGLSLGKSARDLACQSAERWRNLDMHAGIHNFELHAFRAAFQMTDGAGGGFDGNDGILEEDGGDGVDHPGFLVFFLEFLDFDGVLSKYYPEVATSTPSIGRKGKALRRRNQRRSAKSELHLKGSTCHVKQNFCAVVPAESKTEGISGSASETQTLSGEISSNERAECEGIKIDSKSSNFESFCQSGLSHLGIKNSHDVNLQGIWKEAEPFADLIGPYWSLRAALGPLLETLILLDRFIGDKAATATAMVLSSFNPTAFLSCWKKGVTQL